MTPTQKTKLTQILNELLTIKKNVIFIDNENTNVIFVEYSEIEKIIVELENLLNPPHSKRK